ncbi:sigma-70 family RNA polymerase sigma factor [Sinomonas sp. ASV322]|uniref:RNA polymerase sigma factor n=1 Tax=Sinomonas sp. ASV322 TaxID=3041920 RepID=UPI0027DCE270|nr:sigma-70 family RNA polymerase sigma factor [Sinomonas sp. ASV322]MDQ4504045.1 sigma-70 family RNA polymerase sigma factor [Sinomonas sp. ASV322]
MSVMDASLSEAREEPAEAVDEKAFAAFYRRYYWMIFAFANRRLSDEETAREIAADTFRIAWSKIADRGDHELAWLYGIARNLIGNEYRRQLRERALLARIQHDTSHADSESAADLIREALLELRYKDRDILYLTYWEELSASRLAEVLGCSEASAWKRVSRARKALKDILAKKGHGHGNA